MLFLSVKTIYCELLVSLGYGVFLKDNLEDVDSCGKNGIYCFVELNIFTNVHPFTFLNKTKNIYGYVISKRKKPLKLS